MYKDINDPRDPWAWRNDWTGRARTDYAELWVVIPIIVGLVFLALMMLVPLFVYKHCRRACPCQGCCLFFERFLGVLHQMGREKDLERRRGAPVLVNSFENPAFDPHAAKLPPTALATSTQQMVNAHLPFGKIQRQSMRDSIMWRTAGRKSFKKPRNDTVVARSKSCPASRKPPSVPKIRL